MLCIFLWYHPGGLFTSPLRHPYVTFPMLKVTQKWPQGLANLPLCILICAYKSAVLRHVS